MAAAFSWFWDLVKGLFGKVSINQNSSDVDSVIKSGAAVNEEWKKLYDHMVTQLKDALARIEEMEKSWDLDRTQFIDKLRVLQKEFIDCEDHRTESTKKIAQLEAQHAMNRQRIDVLEAELQRLKSSGNEKTTAA